MHFDFFFELSIGSGLMPGSDKSASGTSSPCHRSRTVTASRVAGTGQHLTRPDSENMPEPPDQVERPRDQPEQRKRKQWSRNLYNEVMYCYYKARRDQPRGYRKKLDKQTKINHLFYVDDLKLYGTSDSQLNGLISTVKKVSDDIQMEFGLDKCAKATFKRGKKVSAEGILLNDHQLIQDLDQTETYKYLGMEEGEGVQHHQMKVKIKKEYKRRIKLVLNSELNARNRITAINTLAVPVVLYSYGIIDWKLNEIQDLDKMTRKQLCMNRMLAKKADVDRIYLPCQEGGRSLMNLEKEYKATMVGLHKYMMNKEDPQIQAVLRHQTGKALHSIPKEAEAYLTETGTKDLITNDLPKSATWKAKKLKLKYKEDVNKLVKDRWKEKAMHGKLPKYLEKDHVDQEMSFQWMKYTGLKG